MNYKDTLNLPKTSFSMRANLGQLEPRILSFWKAQSIYHQLRKERKGKKKFILHDGPPYANGLIHIGHALNKILKDIVIKYKILRGFDTPVIFGWDCHGLPVEHQLFKNLKLTKHDVEIVDFRKKAAQFALKYVNLQKEDFQRLGLFCDWDKPYLTLDKDYEYNVIKLLEALVDKGYIYRGRKPVNWCSVCETALAEAEVEYIDKESDSIYLLFKLIEDKGIFSNFSKQLSDGIYFLVWTTTPWTLISNAAVALHPQFSYCLTQIGARYVIFNKDLLPVLEEKLGKKINVLHSLTGKELEGLKLQHPFLERKPPVVMAEFVSAQDGSGCVHIAPGHGQDDFSLTKKYPLEMIMPVDDKGVFQSPEEFKGKNIVEASSAVIDILRNNNCLLKHEKIMHSYPHCWRCKKPIIFRATFQWFLNVDHNGLRNKLLKEVDKVRWIPSSGIERMKAMVSQRPDWCISRQRLWGIPIPAVKCGACGEVVLDKQIIFKTADIFKAKGADSWFIEAADSFLPQGYTCVHCGSKEIRKEFDILDVWFESGASFLSVVKANPDLNFPADIYLEGSDQHRGWFQVSLIPSVAKENTAPFKTILTHGFVVDGEGRKMSKSLGNVIAPQEISKKYGAEILRLWAAYSDYSEDVKISPQIITQLVDIYRKLRNTIRFILGNLYDFKLKDNSPIYEELLEIDKFMLSKTAGVARQVIEAYDEFSFYKAVQIIFNFCNLELSSFYLDFLKDRLYTFYSDSKERRSAQFVLYHILNFLLKATAPILSFTAQEAHLAWDNLENKGSNVFSDSLDQTIDFDWLNEKLMKKWDKIIELRGRILKELEKEREKGNIGSSLEAAVILEESGDNLEFYNAYKDQLREIFIVSEVIVNQGQGEIKITKAQGEKCQRCWNLRLDVGKNKEFPEICSRCANAICLAR